MIMTTCLNTPHPRRSPTGRLEVPQDGTSNNSICPETGTTTALPHPLPRPMRLTAGAELGQGQRQQLRLQRRRLAGEVQGHQLQGGKQTAKGQGEAGRKQAIAAEAGI